MRVVLLRRMPLMALLLALGGAGVSVPAFAQDVTARHATAPSVVRTAVDPKEAGAGALPGSAPHALRRGACSPPVGCCPRTARVRPADGWPTIDRLRAAPPADAREAWTRACCLRLARQKSLALAGGLVGAVWAYGWVAWDYGSGDFGVDDEGWFGKDTPHGGTDKFGHMVSGFVSTSAVSAVHRHWGIPRREAALRGAITAFAGLATMEIADGTSERYGFSWSDLTMDAVGCVVGYFHETSPWVNRVIDLRIEWFPTWRSFNDTDPGTDYDGISYLLAVNVGNLTRPRPGLLDLVDVQLGYQSRGYSDPGIENERWAYVGVGLNVANLLRRAGFKYAAFFDYFQLPFVSLRLGYELDEGETSLLWGP